MTRRNSCHHDAPKITAASSSERPCCCISGISSRATNGQVTNTVTSTMPGQANMICRSRSYNHSPNQPLVP
ncbi:Uncharacterised protein [Vibrio cholerae]|nr:Uncharacterised protein [Vibrio cholerae]